MNALRRRLVTLMTALASVLLASNAHAEFVKSTSLNWISSAQGVGTGGVTVLPAAGLTSNPIGLIIYSSKDVIPAQIFNPAKLETDRSISCFLRYDPTKHAFVELILPFGKTFAINGNVTFQLQDAVRVSVSTENGAIPYVSVVHKSEPHSVLAFLGTDVVVNAKGARNESYLDAGARNGTEMFDVENDGLYLQGIQFSDLRIGLPNQTSQTNVCLTKGVVYATKLGLDDIAKGSVPNDIKKQLEALRQGEDSQILSKYTVLNVLPEAVIALDGYGKTVVFQEQKTRVSDVIVCGIFDLSVS